MTINVKMLGQITRFNGVHIQQTRDFIKIYNTTTYLIKKILQHHRWILDATPLSIPATPMRDNYEYQRELETATPFTAAELTAHENMLGFAYRQGIGELIYMLVTCRPPDISFACIKLAQYSNAPGKIHFDAIQRVYLYLHATMNEGIYYWRTEGRLDLPAAPLPTIQPDNNYEIASITELEQINADILQATVDSDHAGNTTHRKSISGICVKLAGSAVLYKTQYQAIIALSSTEAEFIAACEAGKYLLYLRTILSGISNWAPSNMHRNPLKGQDIWISSMLRFKTGFKQIYYVYNGSIHRITIQMQ